MGLYDDLRHSAEKHKDIVALTYFGVPIRYQQLMQRIDEAANAFECWGIKPGDTVALALPTTPEAVICLYALNRIGAVVGTIDVRLNGEALMNVANQMKAKMLFTMSQNIRDIVPYADRICAKTIVVMRGVESMPAGVSFWYRFGEYFNGRRLQYSKSNKIWHWDNLLKVGKHGATAPTHYEWGPDECALMFQTSGTTGGKKTVMISTANIHDAFDAVVGFYSDITPGEKALCLLPIFSWTGFAESVHKPLCIGMTIPIIPIWKAADFLNIVVKHRPQIVLSTPGMWNTDDTSPQIDLSFLKHIDVCGDLIQPSVEQSINNFLAQHGCRHSITKAYGMTETHGAVSITPIDAPARDTLGYVGQIVKTQEVQIIDDEVCVCPQSRFIGYYDNPEETDNLYRRHDDGRYWIHTGDIGHFDAEGHLYVVGRKKRMIVAHNGTKIFPVEIETALTNHPSVSGCAVIAIKDPDHPTSFLPKAFVQTEKAVTTSELYDYCAQTLPEHLHPAEIVITDHLPTTNNGKIDYEALRNM